MTKLVFVKLADYSGGYDILVGVENVCVNAGYRSDKRQGGRSCWLAGCGNDFM